MSKCCGIGVLTASSVDWAIGSGISPVEGPVEVDDELVPVVRSVSVVLSNWTCFRGIFGGFVEK